MKKLSLYIALPIFLFPLLLPFENVAQPPRLKSGPETEVLAAKAPNLRTLLEAAIAHSATVKNQHIAKQSATLSKRKALSTYLPEIQVDAGYTHLNAPIELPSDMQQLLMGTQALLIKEQMGVPFNTALPENVPLQEVPPLQEQNIWKAGISGQMVLFSGMKVPYLAKAAEQQEHAAQFLANHQSSEVIFQVLKMYDRLAILTSQKHALDQTEKYLAEQERFVAKAITNGLATPLDRQKIELARQELEVRHIEWENGRELLFASLEQVTALPRKTLRDLEAEQARIPVYAPSDELTSRQDLQALDAGIAALDFKRKSEMANYMPKVVAYGRKELVTDYLSAFDPEWYVGVGIRWTIFDKTYALKEAQQTKLQQLSLQNKKTEAEELLGLLHEKSRLDLEKAQQLEAVAGKKLNTTRSLFELAKKQYQVGLSGLNDYLESVTELEKATVAREKARYERKIASYSLLKAQGRLAVDAVCPTP